MHYTQVNLSFYDVLQLNVLRKGRLMFQLLRYSRIDQEQHDFDRFCAKCTGRKESNKNLDKDCLLTGHYLIGHIKCVKLDKTSILFIGTVFEGTGMFSFGKKPIVMASQLFRACDEGLSNKH
ncbi:hypothetical protein CSKR_109748 [Clonorchis sinensis]|uniref:Uncharacterized protein n=1 Tax=Clonorchis sinensis TaxID=79923 RepID=A0A3R7G425_CLOSI|nr:hypothetical protein CSKR_109748 [Clonorchis sinensis]